MTIALARPLRSGLAVPAVVALVAVATFIGLGSWQLQRKAWKEALIESLEQRLSAPPGDLPARERWASLAPASDEFRRVKVSAAFVPGAEALVYTSGSALRSDVSGPGYWVFAPAQVASGGVVVVNRGFVPEGRQDPATRAARATTGDADLVGVMRWPESRASFRRRMIPVAIFGLCATQLRLLLPRVGARLRRFSSNWKARNPPAGCRALGRSKSTCATSICNMRSPGTGSLWL